jgi:hypothetical protein
VRRFSIDTVIGLDKKSNTMDMSVISLDLGSIVEVSTTTLYREICNGALKASRNSQPPMTGIFKLKKLI